MDYKNFKEIIESYQLIDKDIYNSLVNCIGEKLLDEYFELYLEEININHDLDKLKKLEYYIDLKSENVEITDNDDFIIDDSIKVYLKEIGTFPLLKRDEEFMVAKKIETSKELLKKYNITDQVINNLLMDINYKGNISNDLLSRKKQLKTISSLKNNSNENIINQLYNYLEIQIDYLENKNIMIQSNLRLVVNIAKKHGHRYIPFLDRIQEGNKGLIVAVDKFDPSLGFKFSTYATWWIKNKIQRALKEESNVKISVAAMELYKNIDKTLKMLENKNKLFSFNDLYNHLYEISTKDKKNLSKEEEKKIILRIKNTINTYISVKNALTSASLSAPVKNMEETETTIEEFIADPNQIIDRNIEQENLKTLIKQVLHKMQKRTALVICLRQGLNLNDYFTFDEVKEFFKTISVKEAKIYYLTPACYSLEQIGIWFGVSRERIRQIEKKAYRQLTNNKRIFDCFIPQENDWKTKVKI